MASAIELPLRIEDELGTVLTDIVVTNRGDEIRSEAGIAGSSTVRRIAIEAVLVDTGASTLCLPADLVARLGLPLKRKVLVTTAGGDVESGVYMDANVYVGDRSAVVECLALPPGSRPLLGVIPMEMMGLEPDLKNQVLRLLPDDTHETYIMAY
jgi:predicted aspartyl protease